MGGPLQVRQLVLLVSLMGLLSLLLLLRITPTPTSPGPTSPWPSVTSERDESGNGGVAPPSTTEVNTLTPAPRSSGSPAMEALLESIWSAEANTSVAAVTQADIDTYCAKHRERVWDRLRRSGHPELVRRLEAQRELHERVARGDAPPDQRYLIWSLSGGLGNRFLSLTSTFMAAVLSKRVFLMKDWFTPLPPGHIKMKPVILPHPRTDEYFLEDVTRLFGEKWPANDQLLCPLLPMMSLRDFAKIYPHHFAKERNSDHAKVDIAARHDKTFRRWNRFLCSPLDGTTTAADRRSNATTNVGGAGSAAAVAFFPDRFVYVWTNQYYLPALFANPYHAAELKAMFPSGRPYQDLVSLLVIPSLPVVARLRTFFDSEQRAGGIRLTGVTSEYDSMQIRPFRVREITPLAQDFDKCWSAATRNAADPKAPFFLASMFTEVREYFAKRFGAKRVRLMSGATEFQLTSNATADQEALTDMMILAFARRLFVSPGSTFGMFVAAFARRSPIAVRDQGSCRQMGSAEPCFGSWFRRDHLLRRTIANPPVFSCRVQPVPASVINCEQS